MCNINGIMQSKYRFKHEETSTLLLKWDNVIIAAGRAV